MANSNGKGANYANGLPSVPVAMHKTRQVVSSSCYPMASMPNGTTTAASPKHQHRSCTNNNNNNNQHYFQQQFLQQQQQHHNHQRQQQQQNIGSPTRGSETLSTSLHHQVDQQHRHNNRQQHCNNFKLSQQHQQSVRSSSSPPPQLPLASSQQRNEQSREYFHNNSSNISHQQHYQQQQQQQQQRSRGQAAVNNNCNYYNGSQMSNRSRQANDRETMSEQHHHQQHQQQQHNCGTNLNPSLTAASNSLRQSSRCQIDDCPCDESQAMSSSSNNNHNHSHDQHLYLHKHQQQQQDDHDDDDDDDDINYNTSSCEGGGGGGGGAKYADQLRRSQQKIGLQHHQHQQHQQQQQQQKLLRNKLSLNGSEGAISLSESSVHRQRSKTTSSASGSTSAKPDVGDERAPLHVNFGQRSSQNGGQPLNFGAAASELLDDEGEGDSTRKKKYLTAKYGQQQMNLIKKRLKVEMWLHEQLQELAKQSQVIKQEELDEIDIDLDELLDLEDDATRQHCLRKILAPLSDLPAIEVNKFIGQVLEHSKLL